MGGEGRKRREKNYMAAHGGNNRLPPPPTTSSLNALPSKLRKIMSFTSSTPQDPGNTKRNSKREDANENKPRSETKLESKSSGTKDERDKKLIMTQVTDEKREDVISDTNEEKKKKKKRKRKQVNDLRFEAEMEKLGAISKRRQRKKEYLKAKKKKHKKGNSDQMLDLPKHDEIKFGEVVQAPPKLVVVPKAPKKPLDASRERVRLQAIESYRSRKGWTSRPGIHLPPVSASPDV